MEKVNKIPKSTLIEIGNRLTKAREEKELTQNDVAEELGVSRTIISNYENGSRVIPLNHLLFLADRYEKTTDYLLGVKKENFSPQEEKTEFVSDYLSLYKDTICALRYTPMTQVTRDLINHIIIEICQLDSFCSGASLGKKLFDDSLEHYSEMVNKHSNEHKALEIIEDFINLSVTNNYFIQNRIINSINEFMKFNNLQKEYEEFSAFKQERLKNEEKG